MAARCSVFVVVEPAQCSVSAELHFVLYPLQLVRGGE